MKFTDSKWNSVCLLSSIRFVNLFSSKTAYFFARIAPAYMSPTFGPNKSSMRSTEQTLTSLQILEHTGESRMCFQSSYTNIMLTKRTLLRCKYSSMFLQWFYSTVSKGKLGSVSFLVLEVFWVCASVSVSSVLWKLFGFVARLEKRFIMTLFKHLNWKIYCYEPC